MTKEIEKNMKSMSLDNYDEEDGRIRPSLMCIGMPIFTTELGRLKGDTEMEEDGSDLEDGGSESVSSFEEG